MLSQVLCYLFWTVQIKKINNILGVESAEKVLFSLLVILGHDGCKAQEISFDWENRF